MEVQQRVLCRVKSLAAYPYLIPTVNRKILPYKYNNGFPRRKPVRKVTNFIISLKERVFRNGGSTSKSSMKQA
ncbi:hypothetical protein TB2_036303 [Malus domestica]